MSDLQKRIAERVARAMARAQTSGDDWNWPAYLPEAGVVVAELAPELLAAEAMTQLALAIKGGLEPPPCPCNLATCAEPWEPGCGLGTSAEHAVAAPPAAVLHWAEQIKDVVTIINGAKSRPFTVDEKAQLLMLASMLDAEQRKESSNG